MSKNRLFSKGVIQGFCLKMAKFWTLHFSLYLLWPISFLSANNAKRNIFFLILTLASSFVGYFFVPGPLGGLKSVSGDFFVHSHSIGSLHLFMSLGILECRKTPWESFLSANNAKRNIFFLILTLASSFVGYFFVPGPLGGLKSVSGDFFVHSHSIGSLKKNIYILSKDRLFSKGLVQGFWSKMAKFWSLHFSLA